MADEALASARAAEAEIAAGVYRGPLHGIPVGVKDIYWTKGVRTTSGSAVYADFVPNQDSTAVSRLREAGAYPIGKTGTCEFAFDPTGRNAHFGMPNNPWRLDRIPGGSSAGSGAAVAAGFAPLALGTDTGGSVRIPAALCGLTGMKPTYGLVSRFGVTPLSWTLDTPGPMARTALDAALALNVLAGYDSLDSASVDAPAVDYAHGIDGGVKGLRIGVPREYVWDVMDAEVEAAFRKAMTDFEELGASVREISMPELAWAPPIAAAVTSVEAAALYGGLARRQGDRLDQATRRRIESGMFVPGEAYVHALRARKLFERRMAAAFEDVDLIATPTVPMPAVSAGARHRRDWRPRWRPCASRCCGTRASSTSAGTPSWPWPAGSRPTSSRSASRSPPPRSTTPARSAPLTPTRPPLTGISLAPPWASEAASVIPAKAGIPCSRPCGPVRPKFDDGNIPPRACGTMQRVR